MKVREEVEALSGDGVGRHEGKEGEGKNDDGKGL